MSSPYPLGLVLDGRRVLVVGGGAVASRRVPALLDAGADVLLVSPTITPALRALADDGRLTWQARPFRASDVEGAWLVHAALDERAAADAVSAAAEARRIFCVRADDRHAATAWTPAVTRHPPVTVAVLAGGDPRRSMAIRDRIAAGLSGGDLDAVDRDRLAGTVALIGAGPGDPELITVRGRRLLAAATVVIADRLAPGLLLDELGPDVEVVDASKIPYGPQATQDCAAAGIPVTVVPGVTSAIAAPSAAGIPVTHRGIAHEFVVVSGHVPPGSPTSLVDWAALGRLRGTVCVLMGLANIAPIVAALIDGGRAPDTPAAVVQDGATDRQRVVLAPLDHIVAAAAEQGIRAPAMIVIGNVVTVLLSQPATLA
jgi:uroporphyrin-III C-methyltransferase/precorrin-2 dehydrogenase/sirohydrochlorin ferrochelatase